VLCGLFAGIFTDGKVYLRTDVLFFLKMPHKYNIVKSQAYGLWKDGHSCSWIADYLGIGYSSVFRVVCEGRMKAEKVKHTTF